MKYQLLIGTCAMAVTLSISSCNNDDKKESDTKVIPYGIKDSMVTYTGDGITMNGYIAYDSSTTDKRPVVLVVHEWWGQNNYCRMRAMQLAELGYLAMAIDMYGNGKTANTVDSANKLSKPFYDNPEMAKARFDAAIAMIKTHPLAGDKIAAVGYCFGGGMVLNMARLGDDLNGVVSFHGMLNGVPPKKDLLKAKILVCHGEADQFVQQPEVDKFKKQMDSVGADYTFKSYPGAGHAFTNRAATVVGERLKIPIAYNAAADTASWKDMKDFFGRIFK